VTAVSRRFLIAIGSPDCPQMGFRLLPKVSTDVDRMAAFFTSSEQKYRRVLTDEIPLGAEARRIETELEKWFSDEDRREEDCVVIYYAGHGGQAGKFSQHYLFTSDSHPKRLTGTAIETGNLPKILFSGDGERPQSVLLILDTCYAGEGGGQAAAALSAVKGSAFGGVGAGFYIFASAGPNDTAGDGAFVDAFLESVADKNDFGAGGAAYLDPVEISTVVNERFKRSIRGQRAEADVVGGGKIRQTFIRNPDYSPLLAGSTLEDIHHWDVKSRGVDTFTLAGDFFVGRQAALAVLREWLTSATSDRRARVVTGGPGSGKSALLGRLVIEIQRQAASGTKTNVSVHARRLSPGQAVASVGSQLGTKDVDFEGVLRFLAEPGPTIHVLVDALDEALEPRTIEDQLLVSLAAIPRVRLVVGTRKDGSGRVPLGSSAVEIDLDSPAYFQESDVGTYVLRRLSDAESGLAAKVDRARLEELARAVARRSGQSFLYARVVCQWLAKTGVNVDTSAADWIDRISLPPDVLDAFGRDLGRFDPARKRRFTDLLMPLAYAQGKGLPQKTLWQQLATAIAARDYTNADIRELKEQAGYYIVRDVEEEETVYRLFHEAFAQYLRDLSKDEDIHRRMYDSLRSSVPHDTAGHPEWANVHEPYLRKYLAAHARHAGRLEQLMDDADFLLHAYPQALTSVLRTMPADPRGCATAYLRAYPHMAATAISERVQYLALAAAQYNCGTLLEPLRGRESCCNWFPVKAWYRDIGSHLIAHMPNFQYACLTRAPDNIVKLVVVANDRVRVLSLSTGEDLAGFASSNHDVASVIDLSGGDEILIALAHKNGDLSVMNVSQQRVIWRQRATTERSPKICVVDGVADRIFVSGAEVGTISAWSLSNPKRLREFSAHKSGITFVGSGTLQDRKVVITCSDSYVRGRVVETKQIRVWDANSLALVRAFTGPEGSFARWAALAEVGGRSCLVAYFSPPGQYRIYDPYTGDELAILSDVTSNPFGWSKESTAVLSGYSNSFGWIRLSIVDRTSIAMEATANANVEGGLWLGPADSGGRPVLVSIGSTIRVWDLENLLQTVKQTVKARVGIVHEGGEPLFLLSAPALSQYFAGLSRYGNLRVWAGDGSCVLLQQVTVSLDQPGAHDFNFLQMVDFNRQCLYVTAGSSGVVQVWDLNGNSVFQKLRVDGSVSAFSVHQAGQHLLAILALRVGQDHEVGVWDLVRGEEITSKGRFLIEYLRDKAINHVAALEHDGGTIVVGATGHSFYREITAWCLNSPPADPIKQKYGVSARKVLWEIQALQETRCMAPVLLGGQTAIGVGDEKGWITILEPSDGRVIGSYAAHEQEVVGVTSMKLAERHLVISAGSEGTIAGTVLSAQNTGNAPDIRFKIEIGDRIRAIAAFANGGVVAATEEGFLLFRVAH
jgi:WD40 repeat protein